MNEEKKYLKPEISIIQFQNDIVTVSGNEDWTKDDNGEGWANWVNP